MPGHFDLRAYNVAEVEATLVPSRILLVADHKRYEQWSRYKGG